MERDIRRCRLMSLSFLEIGLDNSLIPYYTVLVNTIQ